MSQRMRRKTRVKGSMSGVKERHRKSNKDKRKEGETEAEITAPAGVGRQAGRK